jgi:hypothetical protein
MDPFANLAPALLAAFGRDVTILPAQGDPVVVRGILRDEPVTVETADGRPAIVREPTVHLPAGVVVARGDRIAVAGDARRWQVLNPYPAGPLGGGWTVCQLIEVAP